MKLNSNRIETLTDSIFAIVMTVMIVSLSEVVNFRGLTEQDFHRFFAGLGNDFLSYALSFIILGGIWFEHHWQFHYIKHTDPIVVLLHMMWFMFMCLIPFSTMLLGNHSGFFAPLIAFEINILIVFALLCVNWVYATHRRRLVEPSLSKKLISNHRAINLSFVVVAIAAIGISVLMAARRP